MDLLKIGKKGQVTIPKAVLKAAGMPDEARVVVEATSDGGIVLRQAVVYPVEAYTDERVREFEQANTIPAAMERRVEAYLKKKARKKR